MQTLESIQLLVIQNKLSLIIFIQTNKKYSNNTKSESEMFSAMYSTGYIKIFWV